MKRSMRTWMWPLVLASVMALGVVQVAGAQSIQPPTDPAQVFLPFEKVAFGSAQDIDAAVAMLVDDAVVRVTPPPPNTSGVFTGKEEIRRFLGLAKQQNVNRQLTGSPQVDGNKVTAPATVTNNLFEMWGVGPVQFSTEAVVEGGKIKSYASLISPAEQGRVGAAAQAYQADHPAQPTPPTDPASVLVAWEKVAFGNSQDIDAALALMTDDAVLTVLPAPPPGTQSVWNGKAEIRQALQDNKKLNVSRVNVGTPQVDGNKVTVTAMVSNNFLQMLGVAPVEATTEAVVEDGKIKSYTSTLSPAEQARVGAAARAYQAAHSAQPIQPIQPPQPQAQAQAPAGMPRTGSSELTMSLTGLLAAGLLFLVAGIFARRAHSRA